MCQRSVSPSMISTAVRLTSVLYKYSSRCVPLRSWTKTRAYIDQSHAALVPVPHSADRLDVATLSALPGHVVACACGPGHDLLRVGRLASLFGRSALARVRRRRLVEVGVGVELADQAQASAALLGEVSHVMAAVTLVASTVEDAVGEP